MIKLSEFPTTAPKGLNKKYIKEETKEIAKRIAELHEIMVAEKKHSLLVVLQGMDTSGKDGSTHETFKYCTPVGLSAYGFKKPTDEEFAHDFLWRVHKQTPGKGEIKVFVRSHYEDVLIQRVHKWIDDDRVTARINAINAFEENLINDNNTTILKFYMHLSKERQLEKLQERIDNPDKNWKHNPGDWKERKHWDAYMNAYEDAINRSTVPWIIAPVDQRWYRNYFIAKKVCDTLESLNMKKPILDHAESKIG
ncbi:MAG: polyphosphate kinase [Saprospiraceae bacterium]|nr:polyphosphate kinase [Saprospiraceae bacterium]